LSKGEARVLNENAITIYKLELGMGMLSQVTVYERVVSPYARGTDHSLSLNLTTLRVTDKTNQCLSDVVQVIRGAQSRRLSDT